MQSQQRNTSSSKPQGISSHLLPTFPNCCYHPLVAAEEAQDLATTREGWQQNGDAHRR